MRRESLLTAGPVADAVRASVDALPSPPAQAVAELERLLEVSSHAGAASPWPALLQLPRAKMDSRYVEPATSHRRWVGPLLVLAKRTFRQGFQPFINEMLRRQVEFNEGILEALAQLHEQQQENARSGALWRREVERRLSLLEAQQRPGPDAAGRPPPEDPAD